MRTLTHAEHAALRAYATAHGKQQWKTDLRTAWYHAAEPGILQALRNDPGFGPAGLTAYRAFPEGQWPDAAAREAARRKRAWRD